MEGVLLWLALFGAIVAIGLAIGLSLQWITDGLKRFQYWDDD